MNARRPLRSRELSTAATSVLVRRRAFAFVLILAAAWTLPAPAQQIATVTPSSMEGWLSGPFGTPPVSGFVEGPNSPPLGTGSFEAQILVPASKIILGRTDLHDQRLDQLTALSFWTYIDPAAANTNNWYINLYFDADGDGSFDNRLDYVPPGGAVVTGVWQQWDAFTGDWRDTGAAANTTLADFLTANPDARFNAFDDPLGLALRFNMGDTAASYVGFDGNLDGVRLGLTGVGDTQWNFEVFQSVVEIPTLSPFGLGLMAALLLAAGLWVFLRRR